MVQWRPRPLARDRSSPAGFIEPCQPTVSAIVPQGRKSYAERDPEAVRLAKRLHRYPVNGKRRSLRQVSAALASAGLLASSGKPYDAKSIARMVEAPLRL
jgi:hypothetical protein